MELLHPAMQHDHDIDFARWLHPAMWHVALESWQWIHQVAAPCNVIRGSGMTCHWIRPAMWHVALGSRHWIRQVAASCNVAGGSGMTCNGIRPNVCHIGILHLVSILTISLQSTCYSAPVCEILSKSHHQQQNKLTSCRFSRWWVSVILDFRGPIMGSLKTPCTTSYRSSLDIIAVVFEKIVFFCILATDRRTDGQLRCKRRTAFFEPNELNQTHSKPNGVFFSKTRTEMKFLKKSILHIPSYNSSGKN